MSLTPKNQAPNMYFDYSNPYDYDMVIIDWRCDIDAAYTYWAVHQFGDYEDADGYAGFINSNNTHYLLFSLWDYDGNYPEIEYLSPWADTTDLLFGGEGTGKHVFTAFNWQVGSWYSMCIGSQTMFGKTYYAQWVKKQGDSNWLLCAVMSFPVKNKCIPYSSGFQEDYMSNNQTRKCSIKRSYGRRVDTGTWHSRNQYQISNTFYPYSESGSSPQNNVLFDCDFGKDTSVPCVWIQSGGESLVNPEIHGFTLPSTQTLTESSFPASVPQFATIVPRYIKSTHSGLYVCPTVSGQVMQRNFAYRWVFSDSGDDCFYIQLFDKSQAITVGSDESTVYMSTFTGSNSQKWKKLSFPLSTEVYFIPKNFPSKCMGIDGQSTSVNALIKLRAFGTTPDIHFYTQNTAFFKTIKNSSTSKFVAPAFDATTTIIQRALAYRWNFVRISGYDNDFYILTQDCLNAITVVGTSDGSDLSFSPFVIGNQNQMWKLVDAGNGLFYLEPQCDIYKTMDVNTSNSHIRLWTQDTTTQRFKWIVTTV